MGKIFLIIILIIVAIAVYHVFTGFSGIKSENLSALFKIPSGLNYRGATKVNVSAGNKNYINVNKPNSTSSPAKPPKPVVIPPTGFIASELSPYYGQVEITSFSAGNSYAPSRLSVRSAAGMVNPVSITGWTVKGNGSVRVSFTGAVADYLPSGLAPEGNIILGKSETANFYSNYSTIGYGLKLNKCTGYLNNSVKFNPELPKNCPAIYDKSEIIGFSGTCQNLITSIKSCAVPTADQINSIPKPDEGQCRNLLTERTIYGSCYSRHRNDVDFFSKEWRAWVQTQMNFDPNHDRLLLFDWNNLLVDEYVY